MAGSLLSRSWQYLAVRGVAGVVFGVVAMAAPLSTVVGLAILWGLWALFEGASTLVQAFRGTHAPVRWTLAVTGVVSLVAAFLAIVRPGLSAATVTWVLGVWLVARGVLEGVLALVDRVESRWGMLGSALVDIVLGVLFLANPGRAAVGVAVILGLAALVWGLALCGLAIWVRRTGDGAPAPEPSARTP